MGKNIEDQDLPNTKLLHATELDLCRLDAGSSWHRVFVDSVLKSDGSGYDPLPPGTNAKKFSRIPRNRWDAPNSEFGVWYGADSLETALLETVLRFAPYQNTAFNLEQAPYQVGILTTNRPLNLVDLSGQHLKTIGMTASVAYGKYTTTRAWSKVIQSHPSKPDGILYCSKHNLSTKCLALFDHTCEDALTLEKFSSIHNQDWQEDLERTIKKYRMVNLEDNGSAQ